MSEDREFVVLEDDDDPNPPLVTPKLEGGSGKKRKGAAKGAEVCSPSRKLRSDSSNQRDSKQLTPSATLPHLPFSPPTSTTFKPYSKLISPDCCKPALATRSSPRLASHKKQLNYGR